MPDAKRQARVTTMTGDTGDTSLFGPGRIRTTGVPQNLTDDQVVAHADEGVPVDECQSAVAP